MTQSTEALGFPESIKTAVMKDIHVNIQYKISQKITSTSCMNTT